MSNFFLLIQIFNIDEQKKTTHTSFDSFVFLVFFLTFFVQTVPSTTCLNDFSINNECQWLSLVFSTTRVSMITLWMGVCLCQSSGHIYGNRLRHGGLNLVTVNRKIHTKINTFVTCSAGFVSLNRQQYVCELYCLQSTNLGENNRKQPAAVFFCHELYYW